MLALKDHPHAVELGTPPHCVLRLADPDMTGATGFVSGMSGTVKAELGNPDRRPLRTSPCGRAGRSRPGAHSRAAGPGLTVQGAIARTGATGSAGPPELAVRRREAPIRGRGRTGRVALTSTFGPPGRRPEARMGSCRETWWSAGRRPTIGPARGRGQQTSARQTPPGPRQEPRTSFCSRPSFETSREAPRWGVGDHARSKVTMRGWGSGPSRPQRALRTISPGRRIAPSEVRQLLGPG
jgi:hypothetical protein